MARPQPVPTIHFLDVKLMFQLWLGTSIQMAKELGEELNGLRWRWKDDAVVVAVAVAVVVVAWQSYEWNSG